MGAMDNRPNGGKTGAGAVQRLGLAALALGLVWGSSSAALAASCDASAVGVINNTTTQEHQATRDFIKSQHDQTRSDITRAIMLLAGQTSATVMTNGARETEQQGQFQDRQAQNDAIASDNKYRADQTNAMMPSRTTCQAISGISGLHAASTVSRTTAASNGRKWLARQQGAAGTPGAKGPVGGAAEIYQERMTTYCDPDTVNYGSAKPCQASSDPTMKNADIQIDTTVLANDTMTDKQLTAADALFDNIIGPVPPTPLKGAALQTPSGQLAHMMRTSSDARLATARASLEQMRSDRKEATAQGDWIRSTLGNLNLQSSDVPGNVSWYALMDTLANKRYQDPYWYQALQTAQPENVEREIAQLNAFQLMLQWKTYAMMEHMVAMQASQLSVDVEANRKDFDYSGTVQKAYQQLPNDLPVAPPGGRLLQASLTMGTDPALHAASGIDASLP